MSSPSEEEGTVNPRSPSEENPLSALEPDPPGGSEPGWVKEGSGTLAVGLLGSVPASETAFAVYFEFQEFENLLVPDEVLGWVGDSLERIRGIRLEEGPRYFRKDLESLIKSSSGGDRHTLPSTLQQYRRELTDRLTLSRLHACYEDGSFERLAGLMIHNLREGVFSGASLDSRIRVGFSSESTPEEEGPDVDFREEDFEKSEDRSRKTLPIQPVLDPLRGIPLRELSPGDLLEVRIYGDSTRKLSEEHKEEPPEDGEQRSKPFSAQIVQIGPFNERENEMEFLVLLTDSLEGRGQVNPQARVLVPGRTLDVLTERVKMGLVYTAAGLLVFLFSASLMLLFFPGFLDIFF